MDDLATLLPTSKATWLLIVAGVTTLARLRHHPRHNRQCRRPCHVEHFRNVMKPPSVTAETTTGSELVAATAAPDHHSRRHGARDVRRRTGSWSRNTYPPNTAPSSPGATGLL